MTTNSNIAPPATGDRATVLYIGGIGRSGSTLLNDLVAQHESVVSVGEVNRLLKRGLQSDQMCGCGKAFSQCELWCDVGERLGGWDSVDVDELIKQKHNIDRNRHSPKMLAPKLFKSGKEPLDSFGKFHGDMLVATRDSAGVPLVIDSTKQISTGLLLRHLDSIDMRMVHLVRDARGVAYSWTKSKKKADEGDDRMMNQYPPAVMAQRWLSWNMLFASFRTIGVPVLRVRYEDMVSNPAQVVRDVLEFGGLSPNEIEVPFVNGRTVTLEPTHSIAGNPSRFKTGEMELSPDEEWRDKFDPKLARQVTTIAYPLLKKYGYL